MKKKIVMLLLALSISTAFVGCQKGDSSKNTDSTESTADTTEDTTDVVGNTDSGSNFEALILSYTALDYVTLGEYKGLTVTKQSTEVTDAAVDTAIEQAVAAVKKDVADRVSQEGDFVNIDFEGTLDGVAFDGGTAADVPLTVGSSGYIDGFDEGLVGRGVGETFDLNLTFPEVYKQNESLAGQDVVFKVTLNSIQEKSSMDDFNDEWVAANTDYTTVDEYKTYQRETLASSLTKSADSKINQDLLVAAQAVCSISEIPQELLDAFLEYQMGSVTSYAAQYQMEVSEFIETYYGISEEEYREYIASESEAQVSQILMVKAIVEAEGLEITDDNYDEKLAELAELAGYTVEEIESNASKENLIISMYFDSVMALLKENADIKEAEPVAETVDESGTEESAQEESVSEETTTEESDTTAE